MKKAKTIIGVVTIFVLGVCCGAVGDRIVYKMKIKKYISGDKAYYQSIIVRNLDKRLSLDTAQHEKVDGIIRELLHEVKTIRRQYRPQVDTALEKSRAEIKKILRADQIKIYDEMIAQRKEKEKLNYTSDD